MASTVREKSYDEFGLPGTSAKQSQFTQGSGFRDQSTDTRPPAPDPWSTAADCAKRTQFAADGRTCYNDPLSEAACGYAARMRG